MSDEAQITLRMRIVEFAGVLFILLLILICVPAAIIWVIDPGFIPSMIAGTSAHQAKNVEFATEIIIGRWCNRPLSSSPSVVREITIKIDKRGKAVAVSIFGDSKQAHRLPIQARRSKGFSLACRWPMSRMGH